MTILVAVDPGLTGAFACYDTARGRLDVMAMPTYKQAKGKASARNTLDEEEIVALITSFHGMGATHLFFEEVGGLPKQSASAAFNFGYGCGVIITTARVLGMVIERVRPEIWKAALKVPKDKNAARARASEMIPTHKHLWPLIKDDGKAEAALIAVYGQQRLERRR